MATGEDLIALIDREIPEGRKSLQENYMNLENVAKYCEENYQRAGVAEKAEALKETQNYTTHSLASVAYQINNLSTNFLKLLDLQQSQLTEMESSVNHLNQIVMIHKEKVARREIGVLTSSRNVPRPIGMKNGIIYPEQTERPIKYSRKPIDYSILDDIGHGVRGQNQQATTPRTARSPSVSSTHSNMSNNTAGSNQQQQGPPTSKPPTPPVVYKASNTGQGSGTIGRAGGGHYRALGPPVAPPVAPSTPPMSTPPHFQQQPGNNSNNYQPFPHAPLPAPASTNSRSSVSSSGGGGGSYSPSGTLQMGAIHTPPIIGMGMPGGGGGPPLVDGYGFGSAHLHHPHPLHHQQQPHPLASAAAGHNVAPSRQQAPPPLMPHPQQHPHHHQHDPALAYSRNSSTSSNKVQGWIDTSFPPPPPPDEGFDASAILASPPLPPPPSSEMPEQFDYHAPPPPPDFSDDREGPPSMRVGGVPQPLENDIYGTAQQAGGGGDDPYAATGPAFLTSQTSWVPKHYLEKVVAIYDYQANKGDELSFAENAIVYVIHKNDDGWWEGVMDGKTGLFPYNYVEPCM